MLDLYSSFLEAATTHKDATAIINGDNSCTYEELSSYADNVCQSLYSLEQPLYIGIALTRSIDLFAAIIGCLKAGIVYVHLDLELPDQQLSYILNNLSIEHVITDENNLERFKAIGCEALVYREILNPPSVANSKPYQTNPNCCVLYTSSTTGRAKAILLSQQAIMNTVLDVDYLDLKPGIRVAQCNSTSFDPILCETFWALLYGGTLIICHKPTVINPKQFADFLNQNPIDILFLATPIFHLHVKYKPSIYRNIDTLLVGGDVLQPKITRHVLLEPHNAPRRLINMYGPTENTVMTTMHQVKLSDTRSCIPIGTTVKHSTSYILDENLKPVKEGDVGELYVSGDKLTAGYVGKEAAFHNQAFITIPANQLYLNHDKPIRIYNTGDLVYKEDGLLYFVGRKDDRVKVNGIRIELEEVRLALLGLKGIEDAYVTAHKHDDDTHHHRDYIQAYVKTKIHKQTAIRKQLKKTVPKHMIPKKIFRIEQIPLSPNGKINRKRLHEYIIPFAEDMTNNPFQSHYPKVPPRKVINLHRPRILKIRANNSQS